MGNLAGRLGLLAVALGVSAAAYGQADVTATQAMELTAFGAATGTFTGLENGRNGAITAGVDLAFRPFFGVRPALELRGTYPVDKGGVIGEKSGLLGAKFTKTYGRFNPYLDVLYGRGELTYVGGFIVGTFRYDRTTTNVYGVGGGIDFRLTPRFDIKADAQVEHWGTPVVSSGKIYSEPVSLGVVYHFDFNHHAKVRKVRPAPEERAPAAFAAPTAPAADTTPPPPPTTSPAPADSTTGTSNPPPSL